MDHTSSQHSEQTKGQAHQHWLRLWSDKDNVADEMTTPTNLTVTCINRCRNNTSTGRTKHSRKHNQSKTYQLLPWRKPDLGCKRPSSLRYLHAEIKEFYQYMSPTAEEKCLREHVIARLRDLITELWPKAKVETYGSYETDLYLPTSDLDVGMIDEWVVLPLWTLEKQLVQRGIADRENIQVLDRASVPIIKFLDKQTDLKVDISFNQVESMKTVQLIQHYLTKYPCLKYLAFVLKQFLLQRNLNEVYTGGISSHCLLYLIINFLQMHPSLYTHKSETYLATLLIEFFELYGCHFNYQKVGIRIRNGGSYVPKESVTNLNSGILPSFLYLEDPVNPENDVGRSSYGAYNVKQVFANAYIDLSRIIFSRNDTNESILGRIVSISDTVISYRQWIQENFLPIGDNFLTLEDDVFETDDSVSTCASTSSASNDVHSSAASSVSSLTASNDIGSVGSSSTTLQDGADCSRSNDQEIKRLTEQLSEMMALPACQTEKQPEPESSRSRS